MVTEQGIMRGALKGNFVSHTPLHGLALEGCECSQQPAITLAPTPERARPEHGALERLAARVPVVSWLLRCYHSRFVGAAP